ncbi:hypothetical protein [Edaphobacter aggregans]|uniref:hypothetical protein n=1 Tax=Edaphobacter aggregans TaxID=570835 RepID=UPI00055720D7|nr:hypothetical protein [Edaphobacter aggregans]
MKNVLVIFQATQARTETLALAAGLGAVQSGALIRLRHLTSSAPAELEHKGYGTLKDSDIVWAEAIVVGVEAETPIHELAEFTDLVRQLAQTQSLSGKRLFVFGREGKGDADSEAVAYLNHVAIQTGMTLMESELLSSQAFADPLDYLNRVGRTLASD